MHCKIHLVATIVVNIIIVSKTNGLRCYTCSATEDEVDQSCADDLSALGESAITDCDKKFCTITRLDYKDPKGKLASISRNCVDKVPADGIVEDGTHRTYLRSCKTDLCNSGSGKGNTDEGRTYIGDKSTIYVPGTSSKSPGQQISASILGLIGFSVAIAFI